jgi:RNA-binding protein
MIAPWSLYGHRQTSYTALMNSTSSTKRPLSGQMKKAFRGVAHHLDPVVSVSDRGLSDGIIAETERALTDHELIKVKVDALQKADRLAITEILAEQTQATVIQNIGKVAVLYRKNQRPNPKLSNVSRYLG